MAKTIFITGASRGFGKLWAEAFLKRGDNVIAAVRDLKSIEDLQMKYPSSFLAVRLDVRDRRECFDAIEKANVRFGSLDVVINNAGYSLFGTVEETSEREARDIIDTNFFGTLWITQAVIPIMRRQGHGYIIQMSSALGVAVIPTLPLYNASKFAVEGLSDSLAGEVKQFGISVTILEPGGYATENLQRGIYSKSMPEYGLLKKELFSSFPDDAYGKPEATINALLLLTESEHPPLRLILGKYPLNNIKKVYDGRMAEWEQWNQVSVEAHGK